MAKTANSNLQKIIERRMNEKEQLKENVQVQPVQPIWTNLQKFEQKCSP